jgi:hypothetical protein
MFFASLAPKIGSVSVNDFKYPAEAWFPQVYAEFQLVVFVEVIFFASLNPKIGSVSVNDFKYPAEAWFPQV